MRDPTTVRVSRQVRDELRGLADADETTMDDELSRLVRAERQRRMGRALSDLEIDNEDEAWIDTAVFDASHHASG